MTLVPRILTRNLTNQSRVGEKRRTKNCTIARNLKVELAATRDSHQHVLEVQTREIARLNKQLRVRTDELEEMSHVVNIQEKVLNSLKTENENLRNAAEKARSDADIKLNRQLKLLREMSAYIKALEGKEDSLADACV